MIQNWNNGFNIFNSQESSFIEIILFFLFTVQRSVDIGLKLQKIICSIFKIYYHNYIKSDISGQYRNSIR